MAKSSQDGSRVAEGLEDLRDKVSRAGALIGELREANHELRGEVATLKAELESRPEPEAGPSPDLEESNAEREALRTEVDKLKGERAAIRDKVKKLLERVEKLEG